MADKRPSFTENFSRNLEDIEDFSLEGVAQSRGSRVMDLSNHPVAFRPLLL